MQSKLFVLLNVALGVGLGVATFVLEAGCSGSSRDDASGSGGAPGSGGALDGGGGAAGQDGTPEIDAGGPRGTGGEAGLAGDAGLFVPAGLPDTNEDGQDVGLALIAFTLAPGATGPSFYAAVQNVFSTPLCEAGMMIDFFDQSGQSVGSGASVLQSGRFYQLNDGSGTIIPCVDPGQIAMTGETGLPATIVIDQLGSLQHLFPSFDVDVTPVGGLTVTGVESVASATGTTYTGTVVNDVGSTLSNPSVTIFPVNGVGRPLGMATASATMDLAPGGAWTFQTSAVDDPGVDYAAYANGSVP
jgi:hypothetical protein